MKLSQMPSSLGFENFAKKTWFPHFLAKKDTLNLSLDEIPPQKFYNTSTMGEAEKKEFEDWWETNRRTKWVFKDVAIKGSSQNGVYVSRMTELAVWFGRYNAPSQADYF